MNWLLPLETLPGWPEAPEASGFSMVMLMLIGPLLVGVVVALITFTPTLSRRFRTETSGSREVALTDYEQDPPDEGLATTEARDRETREPAL